MKDNLRKAGAQALTELENGLKWIGDSANAERVGGERQSAEKALRRLAVELRRTVNSIDRPMCVSVFGPSQHGKSYLVTTLCRKDGAPAMAQFAGEEPINILSRINPDGEKESTGLVTRFTVRTEETPDGFPVALSLLSEADIVKIIGNSYFLDGDQKKAVSADPAEIESALEAAGHQAAGARPDDNRLSEEDLWDIQDYFDNQFGSSILMAPLKALWEPLTRKAPYLDLDTRASLFSFLWGRHQPFTDLYKRLVGALAQLGFAEEAYCGMDALLPKETSIIDVQTLSGIGGDDPRLLRTRTKAGKQASLPRSIVTALTAELKLVLTETPRPFFETTDLLDFPGARERQKLDLTEYLASSGGGKDPLKEMLIRGKVAYLFDRYVARQEITSMLLCIRPSNQEVVSLPEMIDNWIGVSHGATPAQRALNPTVLFFILTWFDTHFQEKSGESDSDPGLRFKSRIQASLLHFFGKGHSWPQEWTPGRPFNNSFWLRNPSVKAEHIIRYDGEREVEILSVDKQERIDQLRQGFLQLPEAINHFADPQKAFNEGLRLNDGGASYLADNLAPVCRPEVKLGQIRTRLAAQTAEILGRLDHFYVDTDLGKRLELARKKAKEVNTTLRSLGASRNLGELIRALQVERQPLHATLYAEFNRPSEAADAEAPSAIKSSENAAIDLIDLPSIPDLDFDDAKPASTPQAAASPSQAERSGGRTREHRMARAAMAYWINHANELCEPGAVGKTYLASADHLRDIVDCLVASARRLDLEHRIADAMLGLSANANEGNDMFVDRATFVALARINRFVNTFGFDLLEQQARPTFASGGGDKLPLFTQRPVMYSTAALSATPAPYYQDQYAQWVTGYYRAVEKNAQTQDSLTIDIEQNTRLGKIVAGLKSANAELES